MRAVTRLGAVTVLAAALACTQGAGELPAGSSEAVASRRIVDVHLHAIRFNSEGLSPGIVDMSVGIPEPKFQAPASDADLRDDSIAMLRKHNIVKAVLSGRLDFVDEWADAAPDLFLRGLMIGNLPVSHAFDEMPSSAVLSLHETGRLDVLGEIGSQYLGMPPTHETLEPYFTLAEERDIPVHIHTAGVGAPYPAFRSAMGRPLLLEEVLAGHPGLKVYLENAGYPFLDDMLALFFQYPDRVYADVSTVIRIVPRQEFYRYLKVLVDAGFGDRIMFGSDQGVWPQAIGFAIQVLEEAPFLTDRQKADIFYNNAVRFFRMNENGL